MNLCSAFQPSDVASASVQYSALKHALQFSTRLNGMSASLDPEGQFKSSVKYFFLQLNSILQSSPGPCAVGPQVEHRVAMCSRCALGMKRIVYIYLVVMIQCCGIVMKKMCS